VARLLPHINADGANSGLLTEQLLHICIAGREYEEVFLPCKEGADLCGYADTDNGAGACDVIGSFF
jgi:hypothetical protein